MDHVQTMDILDSVDNLLEKFARFLLLESLIFDYLVEQFAPWGLLNE